MIQKNKLGAIPRRNFGTREALRQEVNELDDVVLGVFEMIQEMWPNPGFNETESTVIKGKNVLSESEQNRCSSSPELVGRNRVNQAAAIASDRTSELCGVRAQQSAYNSRA